MRGRFRLGLIGLGAAGVAAYIVLYVVSYVTTGGHPFGTTDSQPSTRAERAADVVKPAALVRAAAEAAGEHVVQVSCGGFELVATCAATLKGPACELWIVTPSKAFSLGAPQPGKIGYHDQTDDTGSCR